MVYLCLGLHLFPGDCVYQWMKTMVQQLRQPEDHLLSAGIYSWQYLSQEGSSSSPDWKLEEYKEATGL